MTVTDIWQFEVITHMVVCLTPVDTILTCFNNQSLNGSVARLKISIRLTSNVSH